MPVGFALSQQEVQGMTRAERRAFFNPKMQPSGASGAGMQKNAEGVQGEGGNTAVAGAAEASSSSSASAMMRHSRRPQGRLHHPIPITESFKRELLKKMFHSNINQAEAMANSRLVGSGASGQMSGSGTALT
jgi:hypothetical protein